MSADREVTRIVRSWLEEGVTALPDRVLEHVLDQVPATRQRRAWWPARRAFNMNLPIRLAIATAAVVMTLVLGSQFLPNGSGVGGGPTATPAPTPTPTPIPIPVGTTEITFGGPGTYVAGTPFPIRFTVTVPAGWTGNVGGPYAVYLDKSAGYGYSGGAIALTLSQDLYADPCTDRGSLDPQPGPTVDDLAAALATLPGFDATTPTDVVVQGYEGKQLTLTAPASFDGCTFASPDGYRLFILPLGAIYSFSPGQRTTFLILDVQGKRLVISSATYPASTAQTQAEVQAVLDSIRFE